ncbi:MAG: SEL1-like repeat protein [Clostridiales bacterium]|nr:SEL1-like repeat protein [Clostridiales bacterium]
MKTYEIVKAFAMGEYEKAADLLTHAAKNGDAEAMHCLAICYSRGLGVKQDIGAAFKWYRKASEHGGQEAQKAYEDFDRQIRLADDSAILDGTDMRFRGAGERPITSDEFFPQPVHVEFNDDGIETANGVLSPSAALGHTYKRYDYEAPPIELLAKYELSSISTDEVEETKSKLAEILSSLLKTTVKVINVLHGPTVTRYEVEVPFGVSFKAINNSAAEIEYELAAVSHIRIEAPIPGKRAIGFDIPNVRRSVVGLREMLSSGEFLTAKSGLTFPVGKNVEKSVVLCDLKKIPHLLIAGQTGSGKSEFLHSMIVGLMYKSSPDDVRFILIDPKRVEFSAFAHMPHLLFDKVLYEPDETLAALKWVIIEMENRYSQFSKMGATNLDKYNAHEDVVNGRYTKLPEIVIVIDEIADIMQSNRKGEIEEKIKTISAKARAAGIHLVIATQRPCRDVITGTIKANLSSRVAFKVSSQIDSRIILDTEGAEMLSGNGDMLYFPIDYSGPMRVQGAYVASQEVLAVVEYLNGKYAPDFNTGAEKYIEENGRGEFSFATATGGGENDALFGEVLKLAVKNGCISVSTIQRSFSIGYARAARMVDALQDLGYIGPSTANGKARDVLITSDRLAEILGEQPEESEQPEEEEDPRSAEVESSPVSAPPVPGDPDYDELLADVVEMVIKTGKVTVSSVQRKFTIGYARSARIIDAIEKLGYIGPATTIPRAVYITREQYKELFGKDI